MVYYGISGLVNCNEFFFNLLASVFFFSKFGYETSPSLGLTFQETCTSPMFVQRTENSKKKIIIRNSYSVKMP